MLEKIQARLEGLPVVGKLMQHGRLGRWAAGAWCLGITLWGLRYFARVVDQHYPIEQWLFWRYAIMWAACALYLVACVSAGHATVRRLLGRTLPVVEHLAVSFGIGLLWFGLVVFFFGMMGLLRPATFFLVPAVLIAFGARDTFVYLRRARRAARRSQWRRHITWPQVAAWALGVASLGLIYFSILSPKNIAFDALWKHIALAQHYAAAGAIERFPEGWVPSTAPCLAPYLYTWCLLLPVKRFFVQVELCQHLEFFSFVVSLAGITALAGRLIPREQGGDKRPLRVAGGWAARFLFPGVFLYDSNISGGADHIAAVFAAPIFLMLLRFWRKLDWRYGILLGISIVGVIMVKYSAAFVLMVFPVLAVAGRAFWLLGRSLYLRLRKGETPSGRFTERYAWLVGPVATVATGLVLTSPLWLKNWVWHGDPLYPLFHKSLNSTPWDADATWLYDHSYTAQHWKPERNAKGLKQTLEALWTYSFDPNDWKRFHGNVPVFGSLFTLLVLAVPALGKRVRLWGLVLAVHMGIFVWYWTHHQDRYLQVLVPWMAAATAAIMSMLWRMGWLPRVGLGALVAFQLIWGSDVYFIPGHAMAGRPADKSADLIASGYQKNREKRYTVFGYQKIADHLPESARVMLHEQHPHVGLQRPAVHDWVSWQAGLNYGALGSPAAIDQRYREYGVTHLLWSPGRSKGYGSVASELLFMHYAYRHTKNLRSVSGRMIAEIPDEPVTDEGFDDDVLFLSCYPEKSGLQKVGDMHQPSFGPGRFGFPPARRQLKPGNLPQLAEEAAFLVVQKRCKSRFPQLGAIMKQFDTKLNRKRFELFLRRKKAARPVPARRKASPRRAPKPLLPRPE